MKVIATSLNDCVIIEPRIFGDDRGFFLETFHVGRYAELVSITLPFPFIQSNLSCFEKLGAVEVHRRFPSVE
jgi:dTDP-4-dehydrorhamnose 3,5-epimerase